MKTRSNENAPAIVRLILALDRMLAGIGRGAVMARDEALWAWTSQIGRERTNSFLYSRFTTFYPGGETFDGGLFGWEREAIATHFPRSGRILIGAGGAGRELAALAAMGYEVTAFEPVTALAETARKVADRHTGCVAVGASYADLVQAAQSSSGPLARLVCGQDFAAVVLGWTSLSYVWDDNRDALLNAVRTIAPRAPVLLSYFRPETNGDGRLAPARVWIQHLLRLTGGKPAGPGDSFLPWAGFYQALTTEDVLSLAERTGYRVVRVNAQDSSDAVLEPKR